MTHNQALAIAIECIEIRMREYVFGANMYKIGSKTAANKLDHDIYQRFADAIRELESDKAQLRMDLTSPTQPDLARSG